MLELKLKEKVFARKMDNMEWIVEDFESIYDIKTDVTSAFSWNDGINFDHCT